MIDKSEIEYKLAEIHGEQRYRHDNWGGQGYKGEAELRGFALALEWVLEYEDSHPPDGWFTLRREVEQ